MACGPSHVGESLRNGLRLPIRSPVDSRNREGPGSYSMFAWVEKADGTVKLLEVIETEPEAEVNPVFEWLDSESLEDGDHLHIILPPASGQV